jgi:Na+/H+ antiporter NhaD/arsenite permease-like protein
VKEALMRARISNAGASANIVCVGISDKRGVHISFLGFTSVGFPIMVLSVFISNAYLLARYS